MRISTRRMLTAEEIRTLGINRDAKVHHIKALYCCDTNLYSRELLNSIAGQLDQHPSHVVLRSLKGEETEVVEEDPK